MTVASPVQHYRVPKQQPTLYVGMVLCHGGLGPEHNSIGNVRLDSWIGNELDRSGNDRSRLTCADLVAARGRIDGMIAAWHNEAVVVNAVVVNAVEVNAAEDMEDKQTFPSKWT